MDSSMVDNKLNMSLDDIIKRERKAKQQQQGSARNRTAAKRNNNKVKRSVAARPIMRRNRAQTAGGKLSTAVAMKVVNRLVKRAIQRRANQALINRAATIRRRAVRRNSVVRPAMKGIRARRQAALTGSRLAGRLSGISQRSRVIGRNAGRMAGRLPVILTSPKMVRGRGVSRMGQLASDSEAVMVEQREITRPVVQKVIRRAVVAAQPRRQVIVQRRARPVIVQQQPVIIRRGGIRKGVILNEEPNVVVRNMPRRKMQFRTQPVFERVQRVVNVNPRNRVIRKAQYVVNPNAAQMRRALGIGVRQNLQEPQRFESSSTFLQRVPASSRRGRGFQNVF